MRLRLKAVATVVLACAVSTPACAAAPVYFDIGGLVLGALLFVVALVLTFGIAVRKRSAVAFGVMLAVLAWPFWLYFLSESKLKEDQALAKETHVRQEEAYRQFCSQAKFKGSAAAPSEGLSLLFSRHVEPTSAELTSTQLAGQTALMLAARNLCASTGIRYIEAPRHVQGEPPQFDRYELACPRVEHTVVEASAAAFGLVLGEESETVLAPASEKLRLPWGRTDLTSNSVRIVDLRDEATLASDAVYWITPRLSIGAACPDRIEAIAALIVKVLPHR